MLFAILGKTGKEVQTYTDEGKARDVLNKLKDTGATIKVLQEASPKDVRNAGILKHYRASTIDRISAIVTKGQEHPRYALYCEGILVAYAPSEETAVFLQRKARGFVRRVLQRKFRFRIEKLDSTIRSIVS